MKTIVITGMTSGIGKALFYDLAKKNNHVIGIARSPEKLKAIKAELNAYNVETLTADLSDFSSLETLVQKLEKIIPSGLDVLVNNAAIVPSSKMTTNAGFEMQFQVNHLSVAYLSLSVLPLLDKKNGRIITTASNAHKRAKFDVHDLEATKRYHPLRSYMRTKLYNIMLMFSLNETTLKQTNIKAYAVHPGLVKTPIGTKHASRMHAFFWRLFTKRDMHPNEALSSYHYLIDAKTHPENLYYYQARAIKYAKLIDHQKNRDTLFQKTKDDLKTLTQ